MLAELTDGMIWLDVPFRQKEMVKKVPGARWDSGQRKWRIPPSWAACVILRGVFAEQLEVGPQLAEWAATERARWIDECLALRDREDARLEVFPPDGLNLEPRQRVGAAFLALSQQSLLADGMGSGKTIQTIAALELLEREGQQPYPALIVCPNSVKRTWVDEFAKWAPIRHVQSVEGGPVKAREAIEALRDSRLQVAVINWEKLRTLSRCAGFGNTRLTDSEREQRVLNGIGLRTFVADEAHRAKNPKAQQTRAAWQVAWECEFRFALTGTPVANTPEDLWSIMHLLAPEEWPSKWQFIERFAIQSFSAYGFSEVTGIRGDMQEEFFRILDPRFLRRPTQVVVPDLIPKLPPQLRYVELPHQQRKAYDQMRKQLLAELDSGVLMATNPLTHLTRLVQLAASYGEVDEEGNLRLAEPSAKLEALDDVLEEIGDEQAVVFAESRQLIELASARLLKAGIGHGLVTGAVNVAQRQMAVDSFQAGDIRVLLATLGAGGEGLTLTAARHPVFLQRSFSMVKNLQAEDRVWRKGQHREVQPIYIVSQDTIEEHVLEVGEEKLERLEEVCRDEATLRKWLQ